MLRVNCINPGATRTDRGVPVIVGWLTDEDGGFALLRDGATPGTTLPCTDQVNIDGKVFTNYSDYPPSRLGDISLAEAVAQSCNTAFVSQVDRVDLPSLRSAAESRGIGSSDDVGADAFVGQVGEPDGRIEAAVREVFDLTPGGTPVYLEGGVDLVLGEGGAGHHCSYCEYNYRFHSETPC